MPARLKGLDVPKGSEAGDEATDVDQLPAIVLTSLPDLRGFLAGFWTGAGAARNSHAKDEC